MAKVLIISWNTVPVEDKKIPISATGMRSYKLALGLLNNGISKADVAVKNYKTSMGKCVDKRITIHDWKTDDQVAKLANKYDTLIINSYLEDRTPYILSKVSDKVTKVVDAFIPLYFEEAMRDDIDEAALKYHIRRLAFLHESLIKADYILVANDNQKLMYLGAFGAVNLLNAGNFSKYQDNFVINYPGAIGEEIPKANPYEHYKDIIKNKKIVVWFGSTYTWFDISPLLKAYRQKNQLTEQTILFVIGAKNPDFASGAVPDQKSNDSVIYVPWVDYTDRLAWLANADVGVNINKITAENSFSFRNRLMDFIETGLPLVTNGQDPLGEEIIRLGGGVKVGNDNLEEAILNSLKPDKNQKLRRGMDRVKVELDNKLSNKALAKVVGYKTKTALNTNYLVYPQSYVGNLERLLAKLKWSPDSLNAQPIDDESPLHQIDDVLQFVSIRQITAATARRLKASARSRLKSRPGRKARP